MAVTLIDILRQAKAIAANTIIGNLTNAAAAPTAVTATAAATPNSVVTRDGNGNTKANAYARGVATTATAAATTTLTVASAQFQQFTGTTTQTVVLPDATTLPTGHSFTIANRSTGAVAVQANGGGALGSLAANTQTTITLVANGAAAGTWDFASASGGGGLAASNFVTNETPSGTLNGSNVTFALANTPTAGTVSLYLNGMLQEPGSGNDYTISGATITYLSAPASTDKLRANYMK